MLSLGGVYSGWKTHSLLLAGLLGTAIQPLEAASRVTLTILRYHQIDAPDDRLGGEFYARVVMGNRHFPPTGYREDTMRDEPNWTFPYAISTDDPIPIRIGMWDQDWPDADDHLDVNHINGKKDLRIIFYPRTGVISGDVSGLAGQEIPSRGRGENNRVEILFRITQEHIPPPAEAGPTLNGRIPVLPNRCATQPRVGGYSSRNSEERWQGGQFPAPDCPNMLRITGGSFRDAFPGGQVSVISVNNAFGNRRDNQMAGLVHVVDGKMYVMYLLQLAPWMPGEIVAHLHEGVKPGDYGLLILNRLPQSEGTPLGVFEQGSNILWFTIHL